MFKGLPLFYEKGQAGETPHSAEFFFFFFFFFGGGGGGCGHMFTIP